MVTIMMPAAASVMIQTCGVFRVRTCGHPVIGYRIVCRPQVWRRVSVICRGMNAGGVATKRKVVSAPERCGSSARARSVLSRKSPASGAGRAWSAPLRSAPGAGASVRLRPPPLLPPGFRPFPRKAVALLAPAAGGIQAADGHGPAGLADGDVERVACPHRLRRLGCVAVQPYPCRRRWPQPPARGS